MEIIPGSGNWRLILRREAEGITVLRAATCDARARLPETLYGLPVTALGDHALSPTAASAEGEDLLVTCGTGTDPGTWSNRDLEDLTLPRSLERVGDYALMNCGGLRTLRLHDGIGQWGGGVLMNCRRLAAFHLTRVGEQGDTLAWFADELPWELDVTVEETDGTVFRLLFPEYREVYEENCPAHHFEIWPQSHAPDIPITTPSAGSGWTCGRMTSCGAVFWAWSTMRTARCGWPSGGCATRWS